jgi:hypothetical protein
VLSTISGSIWYDADGNGRRDAGEEGVTGAIVQLYDILGTAVRTVTTNLDGTYRLLNLPAGGYRLHVSFPEGYVFSPAYRGAYMQLGNRVDPTTAETSMFLLSPGENSVGWDLALTLMPGGVGGCLSCAPALLYQSDRWGGDLIIIRSALNGTQPTPLTSVGAEDAQPSWSYDGARIAFASRRDGNWEVYRMNADGSGQTNVTRNAGVSDSHPSWSCYWIAFQSDRDGNSEIYKTDPDGSYVVRLTNHPAADEAPAWSPDGNRVAFQSDRDGNWEIYVMAYNGQDVRRLTADGGADRNPSWSPDGQWIVFESNRNGGFDLHKLNVATGEAMRLSDGVGNNTHPLWATYCPYIHFQSDRDGMMGIYRMGTEGGEIQRVAGEAGALDMLSYLPPLLGPLSGPRP